MNSFSLQIDFAWLSTCIALVILMQAGFICLESGQVRSINSISVAIKNIIDFCLAAIIFWLFGYALMYGSSTVGVFGSGVMLFDSVLPEEQLFFLFQLMFCCTSVTIISGAIAERMSLSGYITATIITAGLIYPVTGHWIWSSLQTGGGIGWLANNGFYDYAGSTAVHSIGGWVALASIIIIGPRLGRFTDENNGHQFIGTNLPIAALGAMLLFIGWLGFNGGNEYQVSETIPRIFLNTVFAAATGGFTACVVSWKYYGKPSSSLIINGLLAGLVAITASCNVVTLSAVIIISVVGTLIGMGLTILLEKLRIDDVVGAVPVHLGPGIWGTMAVALFADPGLWDGDLNRLVQFKIQCMGILSCGVYAFGMSYVLLRLINLWHPLRVSKEIELEGLNRGEFAIENALIELANEMKMQEYNNSFDNNIKVDPTSDAGPIALAYNNVVDNLNNKISELTKLKKKLTEQATIDGVTGLYNRHYFADRYTREWRRATRDKTPIALLMVDIDFFKNYNDQYGHQAGDECLKDVAQIIASSLCRPADFTARYGGEEFVIVLPNTELQGATIIAESIQENIKKANIPNIGSSVFDYLTLSIGVAWLSQEGSMSQAGLLSNADKALYDAKKSGRNRVSYHS